VESILKFPRTPHLQGSQLGPGDDDLRQVRFSEIANKPIVVEEKVDGSNCGISFDAGGQLRLQSRGHYLTGGPREKQFALLKQWASEQHQRLWGCLADRYLMYGEWMYAKHTVFYDRLPAYFLEFDVYDRHDEVFLDTSRRQTLLDGTELHSVPVLHQGLFAHQNDLVSLLKPSRFISETPRESYRGAANARQEEMPSGKIETDFSGMMEGIYIKVEANGVVQSRLKYVRADFKALVDQSGSHWMSRPLIRNQLVASGPSKQSL